MNNMENVFNLNFLHLSPEDIVNFRKNYRAIFGWQITIPFFEQDIVPPESTYAMFSKRIDRPFEVNRIRIVFPLGTGATFKIYILVSDDKNNTKTGANILADYSETPFIAGDGTTEDIFVKSQEFKPDRYIKVFAENESTEYRTLDAKVTLILYPFYKEV